MNRLKVVEHADRNEKCVALTFDDGPNSFYTHKVLDILEKFGVQANFFIIGKRAEEYPDILERIYKTGHLIGNHTYSHIEGDFEKCDYSINRILGINPKYVRPPFYDLSFCTKDKTFLKNKIVVRGDVDSKDYLKIPTKEVISNVINNLLPGSIIDFHDGSEIEKDLDHRAEKTVLALPNIIEQILESGYSIKKLDELKLKFN